jgi:shikimate kinase
LEKSVLSEIRQDKKTITACGGGAVLDRDNRDILSRNSLVIWLYASLESCLKRIGPKSRPLLESREEEENVQTLFRTRIPYYAQTADLVVWNNKNPGKTAENIYEEIHHILDH